MGAANFFEPLIAVTQIRIIVFFLRQQLIRAGVVVSYVDGRHIKGAVLNHQSNRLIIEIGAVLYGPNARTNGLINPLGRMRMRGNRHIVSARLSDGFGKFIRAKGNIPGIIPDRMKGPSNEDLDPIRAIFNFIANGFTNLNRAVGDQSIGNQRLLWG